MAVCLAEHDLIVDTLTVAQYLAGDEEWYLTSIGRGCAKTDAGTTTSQWKPGHSYVTEDGIELLWFPSLDHAQVFYAKEGRDRLCGVIQRYCAK